MRQGDWTESERFQVSEYVGSLENLLHEVYSESICKQVTNTHLIVFVGF